jgi:hypothetical protein
VAQSPAGFDHAETGFPLDGRHRQARCRDCHGDLVFSRVASACADCHVDPHRGQLGARCESCHVPHGWDSRDDLRARHADRGFPLVGVHAVVDCEACHRGQQRDEYALTSSRCYDCHAADFAAAREPEHLQAGFSTDCEDCHRPTPGWRSVDFAHPDRFALEGAHASLACQECHAGGYSGAPAQCIGCHQDDYDGVGDPPHAAFSFPVTCQDCHSTLSWSGARFDHARASGFALTGMHALAPCSACHVGGQPAGLPRDCNGCHAADYAATTDPNHAAASFPTTCEMCHGTAAWAPSTFAHTAAFPLDGAHATAACGDCHAGGYAGTPAQCIACHQDDYDGVTDPDHAGLGFPFTCQDCHTTTTWSGATFDHLQASGFALTGAHAQAACSACHVDGQPTGLPRECYGCHADDYAATTDPNHAAAGFPTTCETCHSTTSWEPSSWNHDSLFPIYSGTHREAWTDCADCHVTPSNYAVFECIFCHAHERTQTDNDHSEVSGYQYLSSACYQCHPNGRSE